MGYAAALSEHPVTAHATGEVIGEVLERAAAAGTGAPDLALLFVTAPHAGALEDAAAAVVSTLEPAVLIGCGAESVVGPGREVEQTAAVALWTAAGFDAEAVQLPAGAYRGGPPDPDLGIPGTGLPDPEGLVLLADPFSFDAESFFLGVERDRAGLPVVGGLASAAQGPGGNRLVVADRDTASVHVTDRGAVGAWIGRGAGMRSVVSQGCRPVGRPWAVTRAEGNIVRELGGRPALERLMEMAQGELDEREIALVNAGGLHIGRVVDEHRETFDAGDFLVRNVLGADRSAGAIAVNDVYDVGATVQFHLRDASSADQDLRALMSGRRAEAALVFTCNGRGTRLFRTAHHDAAVVADALEGAPVAGLFAAGEFGPVGGRNFLHGFTASIALFGTETAG